MQHSQREAADGPRLQRIGTGQSEADSVLWGGFPANSINVLMGRPGTGKTILAQQLLFHNASDEAPALFLTTLSEPLAKVVTYLQHFRFFDPERMGSTVVYDDLGAALAVDGLGALLPRLREAIRTMSPRYIVIDSFRALHDLGASTAELREVVSEMAGLLAAYRTTTFLVGEYIEDQISTCPEFAVADSIVQMARRGTRRRDERYMRVLKLRGSPYAEGPHAFEITDAGINVFPRLVTPRIPVDYAPVLDRVATGVPGLDEILDGGVWKGSNTLITGKAGTGKTTLALQFAIEGARSGERCLFLNLQENPAQLARTMRAFGGDVDELRGDRLLMAYHSPVELQIDRVAKDLLEQSAEHGLDRVVIDSLGDLALASEDRERFHDFLYAVVQHLIVSGVTSFMTIEPTPNGPLESRVSSISDVIIDLDLELADPPRRTLRVAKARGVAHDLRAHEMSIGVGGARILGSVT